MELWGESLLPAIEKFDLLTYCREHGGEEEQTGEWRLTCPSCGKEKLIVNTQKKTWHCWVCQDLQYVYTPAGLRRRALAGAGGLIDLIQTLDELSRWDAIRTILRQDLLDPGILSEIPHSDLLTSLHATYGFKTLEYASEIPFPGGRRRFDFDWGLQVDPSEPFAQNQALTYASCRGISTQDIQDFGLFYCFSGRYAQRLVFPVWESGKLVYFQARAMWDARSGERYVKSLNPPKLEGAAVSSEVLFNHDGARNFDRVAVTEGPIDAVHVGLDAVATFGKQMSGMQIAKLVRMGVKTVDIMWDADAQTEMYRYAPVLSAFFNVNLVFLPSGDPGDYSRDHLRWYRSNAHSYSGNLVTL